MYQDDFDLYDKALAEGDHKEVIAILNRRAHKEHGVNGVHVGALVSAQGVYYCGFNTNESHAEEAALEAASWDATIDLDLWGEIYTNKAPCLHCAAHIIYNRIQIVHCPALRKYSKWYDSQVLAIEAMQAVGIEVIMYKVKGVRG